MSKIGFCALSLSIVSSACFGWSARTPEVAAFYDEVATAKVGRKIECAGDWNKKEDPIGAIAMRCEGLSLPFAHPSNYIHLNDYVLNGWEVVARQIVPGESPNWPKVLITLQKVTRKSVYSDSTLGPIQK